MCIRNCGDRIFLFRGKKDELMVEESFVPSITAKEERNRKVMFLVVATRA